MKKFVLPFAVVALALAFASVSGAAAQTETASVVDGFIVGDRGGAHQEWTLDVPMNTDVTVSVEYNPCAPPGAVSFMAYSSDGQVMTAHQTFHCTKVMSWNTGTADSVTLKLSYYEHGMVLYYVVQAEGIDLTAGAPMMEEAAVEEPEEMMAEEAEEAEEAVVEEAEEAEEAVVEEAEEAEEMVAEAPVTLTAPDKAEGMVLGTLGGGHVKYDVMLTGGQEYNGIMTYTMDAGGVWPAVGFTVWGMDGVVAQSTSWHGTPATVTFVAPEDGKYTIDVYNYHAGRTLYFSLTGIPITAEMAE